MTNVNVNVGYLIYIAPYINR